MSDLPDEQPRSWPNLALIAGGLLMVPTWVRYTTLHGPTSFDERGHWLGQDEAFWGGMMAPAMLLIVLGIYGHRTLLKEVGGRIARIGYWLTMIGLGLPAAVDLAARTVVPPFLMRATAQLVTGLGRSWIDRLVALLSRISDPLLEPLWSRFGARPAARRP